MMSGELVHPQVDHQVEPGVNTAHTTQDGTTLLKIRLLPDEKIVAEFVEKPVGCWRLATVVRHVQLTARCVSYSETYRKNYCWTMPPSLHQVFLRDISEIAVVHYGVGESWAKQLLNFVVFVLLPLGGATGFLFGYLWEFNEFIVYESVVIAIGVFAFVHWLCRKQAPQVIFGTRCPQLPAFAITLPNASDRVGLLEEISALLAKHE